MKKNLHQPATLRVCAAFIATALLSQCATNPEAAKFFDDNNLTRISVPHSGAIDWKALDCSASEQATENGFSYFARADVTMGVAGGFVQPPAVLTNEDGDKRVFAEYGFYRSEADWNTLKDDRIGTLKNVQDRAEFCE